MTRTLIYLIAALGLALAVMAQQGCEALPSIGGSVEAADAPKGEAGAGPLTTEATMWWAGALSFVAGLVLVIARLAGRGLMPAGTGIAALIAGVGTMLFADLMARHWWVGPLILLALSVAGGLEMWANHKGVMSRWLGALGFGDSAGTSSAPSSG